MTEEGKKRVEEKSERVGYWAVKVGRAIFEIAVAFFLVRIAEGPFQTIVVCLLGLIYKKARFLSVDMAANAHVMGFIITRSACFVKDPNDTDEQLDQSLDEYVKRAATMEYKILRYEDWILNVIFVFPILQLCVTHSLS